jgi:hypothetical protein
VNEYSSFRQAARHTGVSAILNGIMKGFHDFYVEQIQKTTLGNRAKGRYDTWQGACAKWQLLLPEQGDMLVKWCGLRASMGEPWTSANLCT